jgi:TPR repeat protein
MRGRQGILSVCLLLAIMLLPGRLQAVDPLRALADRGDPAAQYRLGMDYLNGRNVRKDPAKAVYWLRKSAMQGYSWAQVWLGLAYKNGWGVPKNGKKALKWWRRAAEEGNPWAQDRYNGDY